MSETATMLDEAADDHEARLAEIHSLISSLQLCLLDFVQELASTDAVAGHRNGEALGWMQGALEDIQATVAALHRGARFGVSSQEKVPVGLPDPRLSASDCEMDIAGLEAS